MRPSKQFIRTSGHDLPVIEDGLREGLALRVRAEVGGETERLVDGQVSLDREHRRSGALLLREYLAATLVEAGVDTADGVLRALDLDEVDGLLDTGRCSQAGSVTDTTSCRDDLSSTTVNCISVKLESPPSDASLNNPYTFTYRNIDEVEADATHVLLSADTLLRCPLESSNT